MSFYTPSITHPAVEATKSGVLTTSGTYQNLSTVNVACPTGVWIRNDSDTDSIEVKSQSSTDGITHGPGEDRFYPASYLHEIQVAAASGTPVVSWWLG